MIVRPATLAAALAVSVAVGAPPANADPAAVESASSAVARDSSVTRFVRRGPYRIRVRVQAGRGPALVLMHGATDDLQLYDRLVPYLRGRRVVSFDFLGWGRSDKPRRWNYTFANQVRDLDAVIEGLRLKRPVLVVHDFSGPAGINWALDHPGRAGGLVLLNTFYGLSPTLNPPEAIAIFADLVQLPQPPFGPGVEWNFRRLARAITSNREFSRSLFDFQVGGFISDPRVRRELVPRLFRNFFPSTAPAFMELSRDLFGAVATNTGRAGELAGFPGPVRIVFGTGDPNLNSGVALSLRDAFGDAELFLVKGARHYVQVDKPRRVGHLLKNFGLKQPTRASP